MRDAEDGPGASAAGAPVLTLRDPSIGFPTPKRVVHAVKALSPAIARHRPPSPRGAGRAMAALALMRMPAERFGPEAGTPVPWIPDTCGIAWGLPQPVAQAGLRWPVTNRVNWHQCNGVPASTTWRGDRRHPRARPCPDHPAGGAAPARPDRSPTSRPRG